MSHLPIQPLQAAMLFENANQFASQFPAWDDIVAEINKDAKIASPPFRVMPGATNDAFATLSNDVMHITIQRMDGPLGLDGFAPVLAQPFYSKMKPELVEGVTTHTCAILFDVGLGAIPFPLDHDLVAGLGMTKELGGGQDQEKFELRMLLTQAATLAFYKHFTPTVVHWGQSDQLFDGNNFQSLASKGFSLSLYVHPGFHMSGKKIKGSFSCGIDAYGASHLIGKHVEFAEHHQPMADSYAQVLGFIAYCRSLGRILDDGETFSIGDDGAVVEVHHMGETEAHPEGVLQLRLRDGAKPKGLKILVRPSIKGIAAALAGKRNALSGKDSPDRQAVLSEKTSKLSAILKSLATKAVGIAVLYLLLTGGSAFMQGNLGLDLKGFELATLTQFTQVAATDPQARHQNNLNQAPRQAPALFQPALPKGL